MPYTSAVPLPAVACNNSLLPSWHCPVRPYRRAACTLSVQHAAPSRRGPLTLDHINCPPAAHGTIFAEWNEAGQREYNPAILDSPAKHQSALDAEAALLAEGGKKVSLAQCMEVGGS